MEADQLADNEFLEFNLNDLTIGEIEEIEDLTGLPFTGLLNEGQPMGRVLRAVAYVAKRRENPDFTFEDAGKLKFRAVSDTPDPTDASG